MNVGNALTVPAEPAVWGLGPAHRPLLPSGRGGGPVVVVVVTRHQGGRESRPQGEGVQGVRGTIGREEVACEYGRFVS